MEIESLVGKDVKVCSGIMSANGTLEKTQLSFNDGEMVAYKLEAENVWCVFTKNEIAEILDPLCEGGKYWIFVS